MKRKSFLGSLLGSPFLASSAFEWSEWSKRENTDDTAWRIPPYLKPGDTIGITCPAGYMTETEIDLLYKS